MDLSKILSITGKNGLFKVISQGKNSVIVESLIDQKRFPAFGNEKISSLEEISVFTTGEDIPLKEVFKAFHTKLEAQPAPDFKNDQQALRKFFLEMIPDHDSERVYPSDIRKMVSWYNLLLKHELLDFSETATESEPAASESAQPDEVAASEENSGSAKD